MHCLCMVTNALAWASLKGKVRQRLRVGRWFIVGM